MLVSLLGDNVKLIQRNRFDFINFQPRKGVTVAANHILSYIEDCSGEDIDCSAYIEKLEKGRFAFCITARNHEGIVTVKKTACAEHVPIDGRNWQLAMVEQIAQEILNRIATELCDSSYLIDDWAA